MIKEGRRFNIVSRRILQAVKDILFPVFCLACRTEGVLVCARCLSSLDTDGVCCCPICHVQTPGGACCASCRTASFLDAQMAATTYREDALVGRMIHAYKYDYVEAMADIFAGILQDFLNKQGEHLSGICTVVPVPLAAKRRAERGFNQADALAEYAAGRFRVPMKHALQRVRDTGHQARLARKERFVNVRDAFAAKGAVHGDMLLVDDVFTTGATMQECAKVLKNAGARRVIGLSIGRG